MTPLDSCVVFSSLLCEQVTHHRETGYIDDCSHLIALYQTITNGLKKRILASDQVGGMTIFHSLHALSLCLSLILSSTIYLSLYQQHTPFLSFFMLNFACLHLSYCAGFQRTNSLLQGAAVYSLTAHYLD